MRSRTQGRCARRHQLLQAGVGLLVLASPGILLAQPDTDGPRLSGQLRLDKRFLSEDPAWPQHPIYHQLELRLEAAPAQDLALKVSARLRAYDQGALATIDDLQLAQQVLPYDLLLWEVFVDLTDLLLPGLDLRLGKQRLAWGSADRFNPTDNLDALDLSDWFDFGQRLPSWALRVDYALAGDHLRLQAVWSPTTSPALLPRFGALPLATGLALDQIPPEVPLDLRVGLDAPPADLRHSRQALKLAGVLAGVDWSLSYLHGYQDLPLPREVAVDPSTLPLPVEVRTVLPEQHVLGLDLAGELLGVGWWAEAALTWPERVELVIRSGWDTQREQVLAGDPYLKATVGLDYTLPWGSYVNAQWVHGFPTERGAGQLHDYLVLTARHSFFDERLTLQLALLWESDGLRRPAELYGLVVYPELSVKPTDNVDLVLGYCAIDASAGSLFALARHDDQLFLKARVSF